VTELLELEEELAEGDELGETSPPDELELLSLDEEPSSPDE
jgi:hypothetical protein